MNNKHRKIYNRLKALVDDAEARFIADPKPKLAEAMNALHECRQVFEDIQYALSSDYVWDKAKQMDIRPIDFQGEDMVKVQKVRQIVNDYFYGGK